MSSEVSEIEPGEIDIIEEDKSGEDKSGDVEIGEIDVIAEDEPINNALEAEQKPLIKVPTKSEEDKYKKTLKTF